MVTRTDIEIKSDPQRVLPLFLDLGEKGRITDLINRIEQLDERIVSKTLKDVFHDFEDRHFDFREIVTKHYQHVAESVTLAKKLSENRRLLLGTYFTKEYSIESAALFNPSIVIHPQQNKSHNHLKFIMSLRATGEGHISSIVFRTGHILSHGKIEMDAPESKLIAAKRDRQFHFSKAFLMDRAKHYPEINQEIFKYLPEEMSESEWPSIHRYLQNKKMIQLQGTAYAIRQIFDSNYRVYFDKDTPMNSRVIFPSAEAESMGMEDVRFVKMEDKNGGHYMGTYTAYNGREIKVQMIKTDDFNTFEIRSLYGDAAQDKGMALFPEKINGQFAMISRQGGNSISIMYSDDLCFWHDYKIIQKPKREWEMTQLGNSGSPIKTPFGWLLLTHAVGPLRKYVLSATLLDLHNPEKVIATLDEPLLSPDSKEREGYVPNVVYTCGLIQHGENLFIPYAMSDSATSFATIKLQELIDKLIH